MIYSSMADSELMCRPSQQLQCTLQSTSFEPEAVSSVMHEMLALSGKYLYKESKFFINHTMSVVSVVLYPIAHVQVANAGGPAIAIAGGADAGGVGGWTGFRGGRTRGMAGMNLCG